MKTRLLATAATLFALATAAWADRIVLVHGAFQNAAAWADAAKILESRGHDVDTVELPGRNAEGDMGKIALADYAAATLKIINAKDEPVFLVGHSFGGMTISYAAEEETARIKKLIYVAAYLPQSGESMQALAGMDKTNKFTRQNFVVAPDYSYAEVLKRDRALIFANDGTDAVKAAVTENLVREPLKPMAEAVTLSSRFAGVAKAYIRTTQDNAVSTPMQDMMIQRADVSQVISLDTGHSPFLTAPDKLADAIEQAIRN